MDKQNLKINKDIDFVRKLINTPKPDKVIKTVNPEMLFGVGRALYDFLLFHYEKYNQLLSWSDVVEAFPDFELDNNYPEPVSPIGYFIDSLKERYYRKITQEKLEQAVDYLKKDDYVSAVQEAQNLAQTIDSLREKPNLVQTTDKFQDIINMPDEVDNIIKRYNTRKELKASGKLEGIPTPWPTLDRILNGVKKKELWVISARLKSGKSFSLLMFALAAWKVQKKVLLFTLEMDYVKMIDRMIALHLKLPYGNYAKGQLGTELEKRFTEELEKLRGAAPLLITEGRDCKYASHLRAIVEKEKPDVVLVDSFYLLQSKGNFNRAERVADVVDDLKRIAIACDVPMVVTTQFNRSVTKESINASAEYIGYSYQIGRAADVLIGLFRDEERAKNNQMIIRVFEVRDYPPCAIQTHWDFNNMDFSEMKVIDAPQEIKEIDKIVPSDDTTDKIEY